MGGLIRGVNTLYRLFCFFKLFLMVGNGLINLHARWDIIHIKCYIFEGSFGERTHGSLAKFLSIRYYEFQMALTVMSSNPSIP